MKRELFKNALANMNAYPFKQPGQDVNSNKARTALDRLALEMDNKIAWKSAEIYMTYLEYVDGVPIQLEFDFDETSN